MHDYVRIGLLYRLYIFSDFFNNPVEFEIDKTSSVQVGVVSLQLALRKCYVENFAKGALNSRNFIQTMSTSSLGTF